MKVECIFNQGQSLPAPRYPDDIYTPESEFTLTTHRGYSVIGVATLRHGQVLVLVFDDSDAPNWYPLVAFRVIDPAIPDHWFFDHPNSNYGPVALWGYEKLVFDDGHYDSILERTPEDLQIARQERERIEMWSSSSAAD